MADKNLAALTQGERLWAWRKARGLTQAQAAGRLGTTRHRLQAMEAGAIDGQSLARRVRNSEVALPGLLALARRRAGVGLEGLAQALGTSRVTVLAREARGDARLRAWWVRAGWRFP